MPVRIWSLYLSFSSLQSILFLPFFLDLYPHLFHSPSYHGAVTTVDCAMIYKEKEKKEQAEKHVRWTAKYKQEYDKIIQQYRVQIKTRRIHSSARYSSFKMDQFEEITGSKSLDLISMAHLLTVTKQIHQIHTHKKKLHTPRCIENAKLCTPRCNHRVRYCT